MQTYLILGNIFSLLASLCTAVSAIKKSKKDFMYWQIGETLFGIVANIALLPTRPLLLVLFVLSETHFLISIN